MTSIKRPVKLLKHCFGEVSEWFKELVLKTSDSERGRGFESHLLRSIHFIESGIDYGEVPKLAEGAPLERE